MNNNEDKIAGLFMSGIALTFSIIATIFAVMAFVSVSSNKYPDQSVHIHNDDGTGGFVPN